MERHFGICEWALPVAGPLAIRLAHEAGYEGMQIGEAGGRLMGYPLNHPSVQAIYREAAERWEICLHSLNLGALLAEGTLNFDRKTTQGAQARRSLEKGFAVCLALDIHTVVITVEPPDETAFAHVVDHLHFAEALAAESGVEIAIESAQPIEQIERLLGCLAPETKLCMDLLNPLRFGSGVPQEQILRFGQEKISHFHLKDSVRSLFQRGQRGCTLLGEGDAGFAESAEIIRSLDYAGWLISENYYYLPPMNDGDADFVHLAAQDLQTMKKTFHLLK